MGGFRIIDPFQGVGQGIANLQSALQNRQQQERQARIDEQNALISQERLRGLQISNDKTEQQLLQDERLKEGARSDPENPVRGLLQVLRQDSPIEALVLEGKMRGQALEQMRNTNNLQERQSIAAEFERQTNKPLPASDSDRFTFKSLKDGSMAKIDNFGILPAERIIEPTPPKPAKPDVKLLNRQLALDAMAEKLNKPVDQLTAQERQRAIGEQRKEFSTADEDLRRVQAILAQVQLAEIPRQRARELFKDETALRKEFRNRQTIKEFTVVEQQVRRAAAAAREWRAGQNRQTVKKFDDGTNLIAADQTIITTFNKMLDANSVVRESEYARTAQDVALLNRIRGGFSKLSEGGSGLTDSDREAIIRMIDRFREVAQNKYNQVYREYSDLSDVGGFRATNVVGEKVVLPKIIRGAAITNPYR